MFCEVLEDEGLGWSVHMFRIQDWCLLSLNPTGALVVCFLCLKTSWLSGDGFRVQSCRFRV